MAKIKVTRKGYVRKDGTVVKGTSYYTKDKGKPGKTPESEKWYQHNVEMNWHKDEPAEVRRANAVNAHKGEELATARALQARNYNRKHGLSTMPKNNDSHFR
jgi:hypothetical protein